MHDFNRTNESFLRRNEVNVPAGYIEQQEQELRNNYIENIRDLRIGKIKTDERDAETKRAAYIAHKVKSGTLTFEDVRDKMEAEEIIKYETEVFAVLEKKK